GHRGSVYGGAGVSWPRFAPLPELAAPVPHPMQRLTERDHAGEDQPDDQHAGDHLLALGGRILGREKPVERREHRARLYRSRVRWTASAASTRASPTAARAIRSSGLGSLSRRSDDRPDSSAPRPRELAVAAQTAASPAICSARRYAQIAISSARSLTASTVPL